MKIGKLSKVCLFRYLIFLQKLNKNNENWKTFKSLSFSMSIPDSFRLKNCIYLFSKHSGQHILCLLTLFNGTIDEALKKA